MKSKRISILDTLRGLTIISMIGFHFTWDLVFLFGKEIPFMNTQGAYYWQQSICWSFIFLSGFCWSLGKHPVKRGVQVFLLGLIITGVTLLIMPEEKIVFGILTFLGSAMLLTAFLQPFLKMISPGIGMVLTFLCFLMTKKIARQYLGIGAFRFALPQVLYRNIVTTYFGFPYPGFYSTDYFAIFPWIFLFLCGFFFYHFMDRRDWLTKIPDWREPIFSFLGRYSIWVYMIHQPVLYGIALLFSKFS